MRRNLYLVAFTLVLGGCGGDSTGPNTTANVAGTWSATITNLAGSGISCFTSAFPVTLTQTGNTFTGSYGAGTITCSGNGQQLSENTPGGVIVDGTVSGSQVAFDLDTQDAHQTGTISGNSMSGTSIWRLDLGSPTGVITLNGNWSAVRS